MTGATDTVLSRGRLVIENGVFVGRAGRRVVPEARDAQLMTRPTTSDAVTGLVP